MALARVAQCEETYLVILSTLQPQVEAAFSFDDSVEPAPAVTHLLWFLDGVILFFVIPWLGTVVLTLDNDFYYAVFIWSALTFLYQYQRATRSSIVSWFTTRWRSSLFFGVISSIYIVANVWAVTPTAHPSGWLLAFELAWRGVAYGVVQALALTVFPAAIAIGIFRDDISGLARRALFAALTLLLVWTMSTAYHVGFRQFEGDVTGPQLTTTAVSVPALVTVNPLGSVLAQTALHVTGTYRTFESDVLVPPAVDFIPDYEPPGIFGPR